MAFTEAAFNGPQNNAENHHKRCQREGAFYVARPCSYFNAHIHIHIHIHNHIDIHISIAISIWL